MINSNKNKLSKKQNPPQASAETAGPKAKAIKLGVDVHLDRYVVVRLIDGGAPQPPQRFGPSEFLLWVAKQMTLADKVFTCYEAGPFGYSLHRKLETMGATNYVVRPRDWDEYGKQVKTDKRDAQQLALHLDRYVNGNHEAFCVVRVPSPEQEQERSISRQRENFQREKQRLAAQGRRGAATPFITARPFKGNGGGKKIGVGPGKRVNELTLGGKEERIACPRLSARYVNTRSPGPTPSEKACIYCSPVAPQSFRPASRRTAQASRLCYPCSFLTGFYTSSPSRL